MILDVKEEYSSAQVLTVSGASTHHKKHAAGNRRPGLGTPMCIAIILGAAPDAAQADETYVAKWETDDANNFPSATQVGGSVTIPRTSKKGDLFTIDVPAEAVIEEFTRVYFTLGGTSPSLNVATAALVPKSDLQAYVAYADAVFPK